MPQAEEYTVGQYSELWVVPEEPKGCRCGGDESTGHRRGCAMLAPPCGPECFPVHACDAF